VNAAAKLYEQAAAQGQPDATYQLARLHTLGVGVDLNIPRAIELFDQAARKFPPGADRNRVIEQRDALVALKQGKPGAESTDVGSTVAKGTAGARGTTAAK
jgi:TPR repeat protein